MNLMRMIINEDDFHHQCSPIQLDVSLRPRAVEISGADSAVESGDVVSLLCTSMAARQGYQRLVLWWMW